MKCIRGEGSVEGDKSNSSPAECINVNGSEAPTMQKNRKTNRKRAENFSSKIIEQNPSSQAEQGEEFTACVKDAVTKSSPSENSAASRGAGKKRFNRLRDDKDLATKFLARASQSHMKNYFKRKTKEEKQAEKEEAERKANLKREAKSTTRKRKKPSSSRNVTKKARCA